MDRFKGVVEILITTSQLNTSGFMDAGNNTLTMASGDHVLVLNLFQSRQIHRFWTKRALLCIRRRG